jgi:cyclase
MRKSLLVSLAAAALWATNFSAAQQPPSAPLQTHQLAPNVYWVEGGVSNSGIIVGDKGVIIIDAKMTPQNGKDLLAEVAKITPKPVTTLILTHSDMDHVGGIPALPKGITIIAHENDKKELDKALAAGDRGAVPADLLPNRIVSKNKEEATIDGVKFEFDYFAPAHTSGDLIVLLPGQKIVFTGDILGTNFGDGPLIHLEKNGSSEGWVTTTKGILALNATTYVPGHGALPTKPEIEKYLSDVEATRAKIKALVAQGKSLDEVKAALGQKPAAAGAPGPMFANFTEVVYKELTKK